MDWDTLAYWVKARDVIVCYDAQSSGYGYGLLRTLPAIDHIATTILEQPKYTYPLRWRKLGNVKRFGMYPHEWVNSNKIANVSTPYGILTNEYYEHKLPYSVQPVLNKIRQANQTGFLVTDDENIELQPDDRPLADHGHVRDIGEYSEVYEVLKSHYNSLGYPFPLTDTRNLFLQDNAILYNIISPDADEITDVEGLLDVVRFAPYLPLYSALTTIFNRDDSFGAVSLPEDELKGFRKWIQRRIDRPQSECREFAELLNRYVLNDNTVFTVQSQIEHPSFTSVREFLSSLDAESNPVDRKFAGWLQEVTSREF